MVPEGGPTQAAPVTRGFLFADLRGYTAFTETHGDKQARDLLEAYRRVVREVVGQFGGAEIKTEGDSFYVVFPSATAAVKCGIALVEAAAKATRERPDLPINMGVGIHAGETAEGDEGYVGSAVNVAARLGAAANAGEVLVSETVRGLTRTGGDVRYMSIGNRRFKGISEPIAVFTASDAAGGAVSPAKRQAVGIGGRGAAIGVVLVVVLVLGGYLLSQGFLGAKPIANGYPTPTAGATPSTTPTPSGSASGTPETSAVPTQTGIPPLQMGKADPGRYLADFYYLDPEITLPEGWTVGNCPSNGPVHCENGRNNGYDPGVLQLKRTDRPSSQLILYHPTVIPSDPCAVEVEPIPTGSEPFLSWLRSQPSLQVGSGVARNFDHIKTTEMDLGVVEGQDCTITSPHGVSLRGFGQLGGGTFLQLPTGSAIKLHALNVPSGVFAFVIAPNEDELDLLVPQADEVLKSLEFTQR